ncbi:helix-turn-helix transcriptional regulator [Roseibium sp.]|uniref:helix-turn-helix transcriptional regulator n=1 Tax=Roseibium sp. TaxID=1936156 RepID=UPI003B5270E9
MQFPDLRSIRTGLGISQAAAAKKVGISQAHYCRLENGTCTTRQKPTIWAVQAFISANSNSSDATDAASVAAVSAAPVLE